MHGHIIYHLNFWLTSGFNGIHNEIPYPRDSGIQHVQDWGSRAVFCICRAAFPFEGRKVQGKLRKLLMISLHHVSVDNFKESMWYDVVCTDCLDAWSIISIVLVCDQMISFTSACFQRLLILISLALPDPLRTGAYRLEIISAVLRVSGTVHSTKNIRANGFCWVLIRSRVLSCAL